MEVQVSARMKSSACSSTSWPLSKAEHVSALVDVHSDQCCCLHILSCISEGFACDCMCPRLSTYQHAFGLVMLCICLCLQASRAVDVSAYNGWYPHTHRAECVSAFIGLY